MMYLRSFHLLRIQWPLISTDSTSSSISQSRSRSIIPCMTMKIIAIIMTVSRKTIITPLVAMLRLRLLLMLKLMLMPVQAQVEVMQVFPPLGLPRDLLTCLLLCLTHAAPPLVLLGTLAPLSLSPILPVMSLLLPLSLLLRIRILILLLQVVMVLTDVLMVLLLALLVVITLMPSLPQQSRLH